VIESDGSGKNFAWRVWCRIQEVMRAGMAGLAKTASGAQALATFCATGAENFTAAPGRHAGTEPVGTLALDLAGLECALHGNLLTTAARLCGWPAWKGSEF
jgi:hypothetical protein